MIILAVVFLFSAIVIVHELGHLLAAKRVGIAADSFNVGFGPELAGFKYKGTRYSLRLFPFGGSVQVAGLQDELANQQAAPVVAGQSYYDKSCWQRFVVLVSGSLMNIILALVIFVVIFSVIGVPQGVTNVVQQVVTTSPAMQYGLQAGDKIIMVNGLTVTTANVVSAIKIIHNTTPGDLVEVKLSRAGEIIEQKIPVYADEKLGVSLIGISLIPGDLLRLPIWQSLWRGFLVTGLFIQMFMAGLVQLFSGTNLQQLSGPIGIMTLSGEAARSGLSDYLQFMAMISLNIGLLNLLPLPALDGGRILFLFAELVTGRRPSPKTEAVIHTMGFLLLIFLMLWVSVGDVRKLFGH